METQAQLWEQWSTTSLSMDPNNFIITTTPTASYSDNLSLVASALLSAGAPTSKTAPKYPLVGDRLMSFQFYNLPPTKRNLHIQHNQAENSITQHQELKICLEDLLQLANVLKKVTWNNFLCTASFFVQDKPKCIVSFHSLNFKQQDIITLLTIKSQKLQYLKQLTKLQL